MNESSIIYSVLEKFRKLELSIIPTPIHKLNALSNSLGVNIYCKRDDMTGFAFGGNKNRKLDYLIYDALEKGHDSIVTFGSNQSNWCRMTAAAGAVNGMEVHLILAGKIPEKSSGNLILDQLAGASITHIETEDEEPILQEAMRKMSELRSLGKNPYYLTVGGSNSLGSLGYIRAFAEILDYSEETGTHFSKIILASGSAGTQAGLVSGKILSDWKGSIIGMGISRNSAEQEDNVRSIVSETLVLTGFEFEPEIPGQSVIVEDSYLGEGYRKNTSECLEAISIFARQEGIFLDEVYTGKAAAGLIDYCRKGKFEKDENILFIHTGGSVQLFE